MTWFNLQSDKHLLHADVNSNPELSNAVVRAQFDIFNHFLEDGEIRLRGYDADVDQADPHLVNAVKFTISMIVSHRLRNYSNQDSVLMQRQGNRQITYGNTSSDLKGWDSFPKHWDKYLIDYDTRTRLYHV